MQGYTDKQEFHSLDSGTTPLILGADGSVDVSGAVSFIAPGLVSSSDSFSLKVSWDGGIEVGPSVGPMIAWLESDAGVDNGHYRLQSIAENLVIMSKNDDTSTKWYYAEFEPDGLTNLTGSTAVSLPTPTADTHAANLLSSGLISSGAGAPASTPARLGDTYIDTTADKAYIACGTASSADWKAATA